MSPLFVAATALSHAHCCCSCETSSPQVMRGISRLGRDHCNLSTRIKYSLIKSGGRGAGVKVYPIRKTRMPASSCKYPAICLILNHEPSHARCHAGAADDPSQLLVYTGDMAARGISAKNRRSLRDSVARIVLNYACLPSLPSTLAGVSQLLFWPYVSSHCLYEVQQTKP